MNDRARPRPAGRLLARAVCIRGSVLLSPDCDGPRRLADLHRLGCSAVLGDGGRIGLGRGGAVPTLDYAFSTRGGLQLCAGLAGPAFHARTEDEAGWPLMPQDGG